MASNDVKWCQNRQITTNNFNDIKWRQMRSIDVKWSLKKWRYRHFSPFFVKNRIYFFLIFKIVFKPQKMKNIIKNHFNWRLRSFDVNWRQKMTFDEYWLTSLVVFRRIFTSYDFKWRMSFPVLYHHFFKKNIFQLVCHLTKFCNYMTEKFLK